MKKTRGQIELGAEEVDDTLTSQMRRFRLRAKNYGDFESAMLSAGFYAKKVERPMYVYRGNSYMSSVWIVTEKRNMALSAINNTGPVVFTVKPDLEVLRQDRI